MSAAEVNSPLPDFDAAVAAVMQFLGVSPVLIAAVLLAFALESWYSNAKRMARAAVLASGTVKRGGAWLAGQRPVRAAVTVAMAITVVIAQVLMVRISYVGGSIVATPFDAARWQVLDNAYGASPLLFVDPGFLGQFLAVDAISVSYVLVTIVLMLMAYRNDAPTGLYWFVATTPYWLLLFGSIPVAVISLAFDVGFFLLYLLVPDPWDWRFTTDYVLAAPYLAVNLVSGIYCGVALVAIGGAGAVRRLWTTTTA